MSAIYPNESIFTAGAIDCNKYSARVEITSDTPTDAFYWRDVNRTNMQPKSVLSVVNTQATSDGYSVQVGGTVKNNGTKTIERATVVVLYYNEQNEWIGADEDYLTNIQPGVETPFSANIYIQSFRWLDFIRERE